MDKIREVISQLLGLKEVPEGEELQGFTPEQLEEAAEKAKESFASAKESKNIEAATLARDVVKAVKVETERRETESAKLEAELAELEAEITEPEAKVDEEEEEEEEVEAEEKETEEKASEEKEEVKAEEEKEEVKVEVKEEVAPVEKAEEKAPAAVAASAKKPVPKPSGKPKSATPPLARITASADVVDRSPGAVLTIDDLAEAFFQRSEALIATGKTATQSALASVKVNYKNKLDPSNPPEKNSEIIDPIVSQLREDTYNNLRRMATTRDLEELAELQAAGGLCAPQEPRYDVMQIGDDVRPLRDSLPRFQARRGGIRYISGDTIPLMADLDGAVNIYTEADDTSGTRYPKGCIRIDCPTWEEVVVKAITLCVITGVWQQMTFPEYFRAFWRQGQVLFARTAETELWDDMIALSKAITAGEGLGATSDVLSQVTRAAQQLKWRYRISPRTPLRMWAPDWLKDILKTDLARRAPGDGLDSTLGATDAQLARYFAARNIAITYVLDAQSPGGTSGDTQAAGALNPWPDSVTVILAPEGTFLGLDMGVLNFGTEIRDFDMIRENDVGAFYESFENVAKVGPEALALTLDICPDGTTAGPDANFDPCTTGS